MEETEIEETASRAASRDGTIARLAEDAAIGWWPRWDPTNRRRRLLNQLNPRDGATPLQARVWMEILRDTGDDEMLAQVVGAHREGKARSARREADRLQDELDRVRHMRSLRPVSRRREAS